MNEGSIHMFGKNTYIYLISFLFALILFFAGGQAVCARDTADGDSDGAKSLVIVLDPGHGSSGSGASAYYDGDEVCEETLNLTIARYLKEELETYEGVSVILTRDDAYDVELERRTMIGVEEEADVLVSLHNNAKGPFAPYDHGCTVLTARGQYKEELAGKEQELGASILYELASLGLEDQGILLRDSTNGEVYPNGEVGDYYALIRNGIKNDLLSVLIEHAFLDNPSDYESFLSSDEKLKELACADARGIARYFHLRKADTKEEIPPLENVKERLLYVKDEDISHNETLNRTFFVKEKAEISSSVEERTEEAKEEETAVNRNSPEETTQKAEADTAGQTGKKKGVLLIIVFFVMLAFAGGFLVKRK